jgi:hypothetical protein
LQNDTKVVISSSPGFRHAGAGLSKLAPAKAGVRNDGKSNYSKVSFCPWQTTLSLFFQHLQCQLHNIDHVKSGFADSEALQQFLKDKKGVAAFEEHKYLHPEIFSE